jgi:hypothetical protein
MPRRRRCSGVTFAPDRVVGRCIRVKQSHQIRSDQISRSEDQSKDTFTRAS